jgi:thiol-disulfide isomerase/thioredoxin
MSFKDNVVMLKKGDFDNKMNLEKDGKVIVLYFANWCGHCQRLKPAYQELADNAKGFTVAAVDADDNDGLVQALQTEDSEYDVRGFPTVVSYYNGKYFSTYAPDDTEEGRKKFRTLEDLAEYSNGIGSASITYVPRR